MNRSTAHEYLMRLNSFRNFVLAACNGKLTVDEIITKIRKGSDLGYHIQPPQLFLHGCGFPNSDICIIALLFL